MALSKQFRSFGFFGGLTWHINRAFVHIGGRPQLLDADLPNDIYCIHQTIVCNALRVPSLLLSRCLMYN
jgi:hypothetical protein